MSHNRMEPPYSGGRVSKPTVRQRIAGWVMIVVGLPVMVLLPLACAGMPINGIGYLAGFGEEVTVTVTKSADGDYRSQIGSDQPGEGFYRYKGESVKVTLWGVEKGETVGARLGVTSTLGEADEQAYVTGWTAFWEVMWGGIFMVGAFVVGRTVFKTGRDFKSG